MSTQPASQHPAGDINRQALAQLIDRIQQAEPLQAL